MAILIACNIQKMEISCVKSRCSCVDMLCYCSKSSGKLTLAERLGNFLFLKTTKTLSLLHTLATVATCNRISHSKKCRTGSGCIEQTSALERRAPALSRALVSFLFLSRTNSRPVLIVVIVQRRRGKSSRTLNLALRATSAKVGVLGE